MKKVPGRKKAPVEIVCILDKSTSMTPRKAEVIEGFNKFISDQKNQPGDALFTLTLFDTTVNVIFNGVDLKSVQPLTMLTYNTGGWTALLDAVGITLDEIEKKNTSLKTKPDKTIVVIITDGEENSSRKYDLNSIKGRIKELQDSGKYDFVFLGADQDAFAAGGAMGISASNIAAYANTAQETKAVYSNISETISAYRSDGVVNTSTLRANLSNNPKGIKKNTTTATS